MDTFIENIYHNLDINIIIYLFLGLIIGASLKRLFKFVLFLTLLLALLMLYSHYSVTQEEVNQFMRAAITMGKKVTELAVFLYNSLSFLKISAILLGVAIGIFIF